MHVAMSPTNDHDTSSRSLCSSWKIWSAAIWFVFANYNETLTSYDASGVSIIEDGSEGITMELEMQWDGNPNIVLDIKTYLGVGLPVQVSTILCLSKFLCTLLLE